ncbi:MAG TPA: hypothetical protein VKQ36_15120, partial [Ktedonobacterales bacterium]|nr:hypothetical protein [Ktedonobacterales bacterium]
GATVVDGMDIILGLASIVAALTSWHASRARAIASAQASLHDAMFLRRSATLAREGAEHDANRLTQALAQAVQGRQIHPVHAEGSFSPLAEAINLAAERLATLQRDREDRLRLEGALATLIRAVERAWLGLPWSWPPPSGTSLDDLVTLLYTPRPQDMLGEMLTGEQRQTNGVSITGGNDSSQPSYPSQPSVPSWPSSISLSGYPSFGEDAHLHNEQHERSAAFQRIESRDGLEGLDVVGQPGSSSSSSPSWNVQPGAASDSWVSDQWLPDAWFDVPGPDDSASRHITPPPQRRRWNQRADQNGHIDRQDDDTARS